MGEIIDALTKALSGRYWDGKDAVLRAVVSVIKFCYEEKHKRASKVDNSGSQTGGDEFSIDSTNFDKLIDLMLRECKRKGNNNYVRNAVESVGKLLEALKDCDYYERISNVVLEIEKVAREKEPVLRANSIECLGRAFPTKKFRLSQEKFAISLTNLLSESMSAAVWRVRVSIITAMRLVLTKMDPSVEAVLPTVLNNATQILDIGHRDSKYHQVRGEVARVLFSIARIAETDDGVKT